MKIESISALLASYKNDYFCVYIENNGLDPDTTDFDDVEDEVNNLIEEDLEDKGFSKSEIDEIILQDMMNSTAYKLVAYCISLYDTWEDIDELKELINEIDDINLNDFTDEDLRLIDEAVETLL